MRALLLACLLCLIMPGCGGTSQFTWQSESEHGQTIVTGDFRNLKSNDPAYDDIW